MLAEAAYRFPVWSRLSGWSIKGAAGFDTGKIYGRNWGFQLTVAKTGWFIAKKDKK